MVRSDGGPPRRLSTDPHQEGRPIFSRDGRWIYFYSGRTPQRQIWKMPVEGGTTIQVTRNGGYEAQESWDGQKVHVTPGGGAGLKSVPGEGGEEKLENAAILPRAWEVTREGIVYVEIPFQSLEKSLHPGFPRAFPILLWNPDRGDTKKLGVLTRRLNLAANRWFFASP